MKLICIGDSLTFGYGVRPSQRWTRLCAQETGWEIVNEGISGDTTGGMLVRLRTLLAERDICVQRPLMLLMGGANDIFFSGTDTGARANMGAMLNQLLSLGVHTMIGIPMPICAENAPPAWAAVVDFRSAERQLEQYCAWLRRFSKCFGAECIDFRADFFDPNGRLKRELLLDGSAPDAGGPSDHGAAIERSSEKRTTRITAIKETTMKLSYLDLMTTDPSYNLAMEQYVFDCLPRDRMYFMLWQNDNAIIVGKYQNTISEINEEAVRERGIRVVRRLSGGGAVYHDMGNLNFTFITDAGGSGTLDMKLFCEPVVRTLAALGVRAEVNGRNDITIDGKKFSGNSQYLRQGRVMHHGTIMFDSDLSVVGEALRVDPTKIQTKGIRSVRSRVTNVAEHLPERVTLPEFRRILLENILRENPGEEYPLTPDDLAAVEKLRTERYATWEWNYGKSPACTMLRRSRVDGCGLIEAYITVEHGLVSAVTFKGDFFSAEEPEELAARFVGHTPDRAGYTAALDGVEAARYFAGLQTDELIDILCEA
ncbi:MAG: lipoate--protein ligase [Oscillospiraceae bacterium]